jgi:hypothetical protein
LPVPVLNGKESRPCSARYTLSLSKRIWTLVRDLRSTLRVSWSTPRVLRSTLRALRSTLRALRSTLRVLRSTLRVSRNTLRVLRSTLRVSRSTLPRLRNKQQATNSEQRNLLPALLLYYLKPRAVRTVAYRAVFPVAYIDKVTARRWNRDRYRYRFRAGYPGVIPTVVCGETVIQRTDKGKVEI